jgi:hypothetical protein
MTYTIISQPVRVTYNPTNQPTNQQTNQTKPNQTNQSINQTFFNWSHPEVFPLK